MPAEQVSKKWLPDFVIEGEPPVWQIGVSKIDGEGTFDEVFARQVQALGRKGDLLVAISTSGNSPNVLRAVEEARKLGVTTVGLLGKGGGKLKDMVDIAVLVPQAETSDRIQEVHIKVLHIAIEAVERRLFPANYR